METNNNNIDDSDGDTLSVSSTDSTVSSSSSKSSHNDEQFPRQMIVSNAGTNAVNGVYNYNGIFDNVPSYSKNGVWQNIQETFLLFRCRLTDNSKRWYVSIFPKNTGPGTNKDVDFYKAISTNDDRELPCTRNWTTAISTGMLGINPPPRVTALRRNILNMNAPPRQMIVSNAGINVVNGIYNYNGSFDGVAKYSKIGIWNDVRETFSLFRCRLTDHTKRWYVSIVPDKMLPGTNKDLDFYMANATNDLEELPPDSSTNWMTEMRYPMGCGIDPPPTVRVVLQWDVLKEHIMIRRLVEQERATKRLRKSKEEIHHSYYRNFIQHSNDDVFRHVLQFL